MSILHWRLLAFPWRNAWVQDRAAWMKYGPLQSRFAQKRLLRRGSVLKHPAPVITTPTISVDCCVLAPAHLLTLSCYPTVCTLAQSIISLSLYHTSDPDFKRSRYQYICDILWLLLPWIWHLTSSIVSLVPQRPFQRKLLVRNPITIL